MAADAALSGGIGHPALKNPLNLSFTLYSLILAADASVVLQIPMNPIDHPARATQAIVFVTGVVGASSGSPRVHAGLGAFSMGSLLIAMFILFAGPGSLAR